MQHNNNNQEESTGINYELAGITVEEIRGEADLQANTYDEFDVDDMDSFDDEVVATISKIQEQAETFLVDADRDDRAPWILEETNDFLVVAGNNIRTELTTMVDDERVREVVLLALNAAGKTRADDTQQPLSYYVLPADAFEIDGGAV